MVGVCARAAPAGWRLRACHRRAPTDHRRAHACDADSARCGDLIAAVAAAASLIPAFRATRVDPLVALKDE
jgi:hypothetical protein